MPLPNIKELLHLVPDVEKAGGEHVAASLEQKIPQRIATEVSAATGQLHSQADITPGFQHDPMAILNPAHSSVGDEELRSAQIKVSLPDQYASQKTGWGNKYDRIILNKEGQTDTVKFREFQEKKAKEAEAMKAKVEEELQKAA